MKKSPYILKNLSIHKMPGFPRGLASLNDIASQVNIVVGANASGKSSTARMIQQIIWQNNTKGIEAEASVELDQDAWEIKIDSARTLVQRNGIDAEISGLPTGEGQHRYLLALHNLVEGKETDLAKEIAKQSIGGFDLDAAQKSLNYSSRILNRSNSEFKEFEKTDKRYKEVRNQQKELKREENKLSNLNADKHKALFAKKLAEFYGIVADFKKANSEYLILAEQVDAFPNSIKNCSGDEYERIEDYEKQIEEHRKNIEKAKENIEKSQEELKMLKIPEHGVENIIIDEIEHRIMLLRDFERDIQDLKTKNAGLEKQEEIVLDGFDYSIDVEKWRGLKLADISGLDKMLQDAHQVLGEKEFFLAEIRMLRREVEAQDENTHTEDVINQGIKTLSKWLKEPIGGKGITIEILVLISLIGIATALLTYFIGWIGLFGLILIVGLFLYALLTKDKSSGSLQFRENDFINSGLHSPSSWTVEDVTNRLEELIANLGDSKENKRIHQRLETCRERLNKLQPRTEQLNKAREEWIDKLQTAPSFPEDNSNDFSSLYWFLIQVRKWQEIRLQLKSQIAEKEKFKEQFENELTKINSLFQNSNFEEAKDSIEAKAKFAELKSQENIRKEQSRRITQNTQVIRDQEKFKKKSENNLAKIFELLDIENNEKEKVRELVGEIDNYKQVSKNHYAGEQSLIKERNILKEHSLYAEYEEEIKNLTADQAKEKANQQKEIAEGLEELQKQITRIETLIQQKKRGHELEDLLSQREEALDNLQQLYENNLSSVTGDLIIRQLKKETQHKNRPKVFKRANQIFNRITNGRYELRLAEKGEVRFSAYDTVLKLGQDLSQLSTGTRVQLLLSVRLAYVETVESSIKLPILADELLANSDDQRAKAIIESLIEISREGRQVFYFTAQADEVGKWLTHLEQTDLNYKVIQLDTDSDQLYDYRDFKLELNSLKFTQNIPKPNGENHSEYGNSLSIPTFNLLLQNETELPLWYLIEEVELLYKCLHRGIKTWGQLESFYNYGGKIQELDKEEFQELAKQIGLLLRFQELYRKGRTRPIDRDVLADSGIISDAFMKRVVKKLEGLNRNPKRLIQALKEGEVARFRTGNAEELEEYLISTGYIDVEEQHEPTEILIKLQAFISNADMRVEKAGRFIERVLVTNNQT